MYYQIYDSVTNELLTDHQVDAILCTLTNEELKSDEYCSIYQSLIGSLGGYAYIIYNHNIKTLKEWVNYCCTEMNVVRGGDKEPRKLDSYGSINPTQLMCGYIYFEMFTFKFF